MKMKTRFTQAEIDSLPIKIDSDTWDQDDVNKNDDVIVSKYYQDAKPNVKPKRKGVSLMHDKNYEVIDLDGVNAIAREVDSKANEMSKHYSKINHPSHYQGVKGMEVREVQENFIPYYSVWGVLVASDIKDTIKYILRAPNKNGLEDLKKAHKMLEYAIDEIEASCE